MKTKKAPLKNYKNDQLAILFSVLIFLLIFFSLPKLVGGQPKNKLDENHCNKHGNINATDGNCICHSGYYGFRCNLKFCPFGRSW